MLLKRFVLALSALFLCGCQTSPSTLKKNRPILRTCMSVDVSSLDPRKGVNMANQSVVRMLFTGLVRLDEQLAPQLELADSYRVSPDFKTYTFVLRDCCWSDGSPITAYDFEQTWKAALTPSYSSANTNLFFLIKNGRRVFLKEVPAEEFGAKAMDDKTLKIELEQSNPHFLHSLINSIFSPVHSSMRFSSPDEKHLVCSGPFCLKKHLFQDQVILEKNSLYWDASHVQLQEIHYYVVKDPSTALLLFEQGKIDWMGEPMVRISMDAIPHLRKKGVLHAYQAAGCQWMFLNTTKFPLNNRNIRKALAYAIDRQKILQNVLHADTADPSLGLIPKILKGERWHPWFEDNAIKEARRLFEQGLRELGISAEQFPVLTVNYASPPQVLLAIQQMWESQLGVKIKLESVDGPVLFSKYYEHDFQMLWLGWVIQYNDPVNMLEIFKLKDIQPNHTGWEHPDFIRYANASSTAATDQEKWAHVEAAEEIFCREMPSIPVTDFTAFYVQQPGVKGVRVNQLFQIDFDRASLE